MQGQNTISLLQSAGHTRLYDQVKNGKILGILTDTAMTTNKFERNFRIEIQAELVWYTKEGVGAGIFGPMSILLSNSVPG